jgi:hypothetical protein
MDGSGEYVLCVGGSFFRRYDIEFGFNPDFEPHLYTYGSNEEFYENERGTRNVSGASQGHEAHKRNAHMVPLRTFQVEAPTVQLNVRRHLGSRKLLAGRGPVEVEYEHSAADGHPDDDSIGMYEVATGLRLEELLVPAANSGTLRFKAVNLRNSPVAFRYLTKQRETRTSPDAETRRKQEQSKGAGGRGAKGKSRRRQSGRGGADDDQEMFGFLDKLDAKDGDCFFSSARAPPAKRVEDHLGSSGCFWLSESEITLGELKCGHVVAGASEEVAVEGYGSAMGDRIGGITASRECNVCVISTTDELACTVKRRVMEATVLPLRQFCEARDIAFSFTDLNDVMYAEGVATGDRLRLALDVIDRCSPFVLVVMGEDYGELLPLKTKRAGPGHRHKHSSVLYDPLSNCPLELLRGCSAGGGVCSMSDSEPRAGPGVGPAVGATGVGTKYPWLISWQNASLRSSISPGDGSSGAAGAAASAVAATDGAGGSSNNEEDCFGGSFFELALAYALLLQPDTTARQRCTVLVGTEAESARALRVAEDERHGGGLSRVLQRQNTSKILRMKAQLRHEPPPTPEELVEKRKLDAMDELRALISAVGGSVSVFDEKHTFWDESADENIGVASVGDGFGATDTLGSDFGSMGFGTAATGGSTGGSSIPKRYESRKDASAIVSSRLMQQISSTWASAKPTEYELNVLAVEAWKETVVRQSYVPDERTEEMLSSFVDTVRERAIDAAAAEWKIAHAQNTMSGGGFGWDADAAVEGGEGEIELAGSATKEIKKSDLAKLAAIDEDLISSGGRAVMIEGPAGAGKSALAAHWAEHTLPPSYARCMSTGKYVEEICQPVVCFDCLLGQGQEGNYNSKKARLHKAVHQKDGAEDTGFTTQCSMPVVSILALIGSVPTISDELTLLNYLISAVSQQILTLETTQRKRREAEREAAGLSQGAAAGMMHRLTVARKNIHHDEFLDDKAKSKSAKGKAKGGGKADSDESGKEKPVKVKVNKLSLPAKQQVANLRERLWELLARLAKLATVVLVLDGLDNLRSADPNFAKPDKETGRIPEVEWWLPEIKKIPHNVLIVGTCTEGSKHAEDAAKKGEWAVVKLEGLSPEKISQVCWQSLHQEAQGLDEDLVAKLCASELCANPFNLTLLLEEVRTCTFANAMREEPDFADSVDSLADKTGSAVAAMLELLLECPTQNELMTAVAEQWAVKWPGLTDVLSYVLLARDLLGVELIALLASDGTEDDIHKGTPRNGGGQSSSVLASISSFMPPTVAAPAEDDKCSHQLLLDVLRCQLVSVHGKLHLSTDRWKPVILSLWLPEDAVEEGGAAKKPSKKRKDDGGVAPPQPLVPKSQVGPMRRMLAYYRTLPSYTRRHCELPYYLLQLGLKGECRKVLTAVPHFNTFCFSGSITTTSFSSTNWPLFVWYVEQLQWPKEAVVTALVVQFRGYFKLQVQASLDELFEFKIGDAGQEAGIVWKEEHLVVFDRIVKGAKLLSKGNDPKLERKVTLSRKKLKAKVATVMALLEKINRHKEHVARMHEQARLARSSTKLLSSKQMGHSDAASDEEDDDGMATSTRFPMI